MDNNFFIVLWLTATAFGTIALAWGLMSFASFLVRQWRKKVFRTALYIAQERPDLLRQAGELLEVPSTSEIVIPAEAHRRGPVESIHTVPRAQLEDHCLRLEAGVMEIRDRWLEAHQEVEHWKTKAAHTEMLRKRYWNRIKRVCLAEQEDGNVFAALHPALARAGT